MTTQEFEDRWEYSYEKDLYEHRLSSWRRDVRFNAILVLIAALGALGMLLGQHWVLTGLFTVCACVSTAALTIARREVRRLTIELITLRLEQ